MKEKYRKPVVFSGMDSDAVFDKESYQPELEGAEEFTEEEKLRRLVGVYDYDTGALGKSHSAYHLAGSWNDAREAVTKLLYAVYCDNESFLSGIPQKLLENIDTFIALDFLERSPEGKLILNVPVLSLEDKNEFYQLMGEYTEKLSMDFPEEL